MDSKMERRAFSFDIEVRADGDGPRIVGHAAVFNQYTDLGWFQERVLPGAFADSIQADDVRALWNHDPNFVLGRNRSGTLKLYEDERGLAIEIDPPDTQTARDLMTLMKRGDITQMSFGFQTLEDSWSYGEGSDPDKRDLVKVRLWDVSPVTFPAYTNTDVAVRSLEDWRALHVDSKQRPADIPQKRSSRIPLLRRRLALMEVND